METQEAHGLESLYRAHQHELLRFLLRRTGSADEAEDILQELWLKLRQPGSTPVLNGRAYLFRMAHNLVIDRRRGQQRRMVRERLWIDELHGHGHGEAEMTLVDRTASAEDNLIESQEFKHLHAAIAGLPAGAQRVLILHKLEGLEQSEVARRLGISRSGVEKHMAVAMKHLRRALQHEG